MEKENLQDISLQSLQWLESRGLFGGGGGGGSMHHMGSNKNLNNNSGNATNVVTSASASGNHQNLGMEYLEFSILFCLNEKSKLLFSINIIIISFQMELAVLTAYQLLSPPIITI